MVRTEHIIVAEPVGDHAEANAEERMLLVKLRDELGRQLRVVDLARGIRISERAPIVAEARDSRW